MTKALPENEDAKPKQYWLIFHMVGRNKLPLQMVDFFKGDFVISRICSKDFLYVHRN